MQQRNYTIREATEADAEAIIKMHAQSWLDTYPNEEAGVTREWVKERADTWLTPEKLESRRARIRQASPSGDMMYKIAVDDKGVVVGIACPVRDENAQRVGGLYVDKEYQGSGLAQKLMAEIIKWADPKRPLELEVASYNERAKAFYRKYAFWEIKELANTHGNIPTVVMIRRGEKE